MQLGGAKSDGALKLTRSHRSAHLAAGWVPDEDLEELRDLVRAREAARQGQLPARHRLNTFLLRTSNRITAELPATQTQSTMRAEKFFLRGAFLLSPLNPQP